jgi:pilus assembly protein CpaB
MCGRRGARHGRIHPESFMRSKSIVLLVLALGCGLVASIGISQMMDARNKAAADLGDKQPIFVALADIAPNEELTAQNIKLEEWPKSITPAGALTKLEDVEGKRCRTKLFVGEPILSSKLLGANEAMGAAKEIPEGMRVVHVKVDSVTGSSNLILPGDRVDVLVFKQPGNDMNSVVAAAVLQDIKVFAVDTHTESEFSRNKTDQGGEPITAKSIALLVTPQQAVVLHAATEMSGAVRLVLRNPEDKEQVVTKGASVGDIFGSDQRWGAKRDDDDPQRKGKEDLTKFLNDQKNSAPPEPPLPSDRSAEGPRRRMIVIYGSELQQVDFADNGALPTNPFKKDGAAPLGGVSSQLTGDSVPPTPQPPDDNEEEFISPE